LKKDIFMYMGKKILLAVAMAAIVSGSAVAEDQGSGKIKFKGVVIDAPCSIAPDSVDKEVDLGEVTTAVINANKKSTAVPVDINLENCQLDDPADETDTPITKVDVTFTSAATDATDTSLMSNTYASGAQNVGVRLLDNAEANITLGAANEIALLAGSTTQTLHFKALMEVASGKTATAGQVEATANYVLMYK
jgi:type 1 fimbria pilin